MSGRRRMVRLGAAAPAALVAVALAACADERAPRVPVAAVAATPCDRPTARLGVGVLVDDRLLLTAAHVVDGDLRDLTVDGHPARVAAIDARSDTAVLALGHSLGAPAPMADAVAGDTVRIVTPSGSTETVVLRKVSLDVHDATAGLVNTRASIVLDATVTGGTSGAPVVDREDRVVAIVTVTHAGRDVTYATVASEGRQLVESLRGDVTRPSLAAPEPCA